MAQKKQNGFSMIGIIVAMFITSVALVSILGLVTTSLKAAETSKMKLIASGLAQEAIEIVRDMRKGQIEWNNWYANIANGDYRVQYNSASLLSFLDTPLEIAGNGLYQYNTGVNSGFYRKVTLTKLSANEVKVLVEVKWKIKSNWSYLRVEDRLWNWK
ncbi:prepilin-type N-terminal cleavage/methylation domain-containing protein [Patescibacteria group bacterium]|nr:prepilin-type N-terminal cleavage/methylation domain-containing protein [Patescibacteria group bacterium]